MPELAFRGPVTYRAAKELMALPLSEMQMQIDRQEAQFKKEATAGQAASLVIERLRNGNPLVATPKGKRVVFSICGEQIESRVIKQLCRRGYFSYDEIEKIKEQK